MSLRVCTEKTGWIRGECVTVIITLGLSLHATTDRNTSVLWKVNMYDAEMANDEIVGLFI